MRSTFIALLLFSFACSSKGPAGKGGPDGGAGGTVTSIDVSPSSAQVAIVNGTPAAPASFTATAHYADGHSADITSTASWALGDNTIGSISIGTFTASVAHGGVSSVTASSGGATGTAQVEVDYTSTRISTDDGSTAPSNAPSLFAGATPDSTLAPGVVYPLDGVTVPLNLGQLEVQWTKPAASADLFEVALLGTALDVRIYTNAPLTTGGRLSLTGDEWAAISATAAGSKISVQVTGMSSADPTKSGASAAAAMTIDSKPVNGGIYYWTPTNQGIERRAFDDGNMPAQNFYSASDTGGHCVACHVLSRDGKKAVVTFDGGGSASTLLDVATKTQLIAPSSTMNLDFASFSPDGTKLVAQNQNSTPTGALTIYDTSGGATQGQVLSQILPADGTRGSHPDWSADGKMIVFAQAPAAAWASDWDFQQGSIVVVSDDGTGKFGSPKTVVTSAGENNYYPSFSPDGKWILFNRAASGSSYNNPAATVMVVATDGSGAPIALGNANATGVLTDSWPRWSPFVQTYADGSTRMYFTFSSKRDYGIELVQPADTSNQRPQIWMSTFSPALAQAGQDPSVAPFWLPFQDLTTSNHIAQWTQAIITPVN